jgi:hypothetical protein
MVGKADRRFARGPAETVDRVLDAIQDSMSSCFDETSRGFPTWRATKSAAGALETAKDKSETTCIGTPAASQWPDVIHKPNQFVAKRFGCVGNA